MRRLAICSHFLTVATSEEARLAAERAIGLAGAAEATPAGREVALMTGS